MKQDWGLGIRVVMFSSKWGCVIEGKGSLGFDTPVPVCNWVFHNYLGVDRISCRVGR